MGGGKLYFAQFGPEAGEDVLFLHGGLGSSNYWAHQVSALAGQYRVTVMDTRGHGRSPMTSKQFGFSLFAQDVDGLLDALGLRSGVSVVGWSDGGITGLRLAMKKPERVRGLFAFGANANPEGLIAGGSRKPAFASYVARCKEEYKRLSSHPEKWPELVAGMGAMWRREPNFSWGELAKISVPTTIAFGEHDEIIRREHAERIAKAIPGAWPPVILSNVSHFAMLQDPDQFSEALRRFLTAQRGEAANL